LTHEPGLPITDYLILIAPPTPPRSRIQLVTLDKQSVNFGLDGRWYAVRGDGSPEWGVVFTMTLLFPK
jgi:hypothetical protein